MASEEGPIDQTGPELEIPDKRSLAQDAKCPAPHSGIQDLADRFHKLFQGLETAHGEYVIDGSVSEDGKRGGRAVTVRSPVTHRLWEAHLEGSKGLGVICIRADNTVMWGCLDVDQYSDLDHGRVAATLARMHLPLVCCRSKSGGLHAFCFALEPVPAARMQSKLKEISALIGFGNCEVNPKQTKILADQGDLGSWVNAPYFNYTDTNRYAINSEGYALTAEEFLALADSRKVTPEWFDQRTVSSRGQQLLPDGPPCLQRLLDENTPKHTWSDTTLNLGVYCRKADPTNWEGKLVQLATLDRPVDVEQKLKETQDTIRSLKKKDYTYSCKREPLLSRCDKETCLQRRFGISDGLPPGLPAFGTMQKHIADGADPIFIWPVAGVPVKVTYKELLNIRKFRDCCVRDGALFPPLMDQDKWDRIVGPAVSSAEIIHAEEDLTVDGEIWQHVESFMTQRATTKQLDDFVKKVQKPFLSSEVITDGSGKRYGDGESAYAYFTMATLNEFLTRKRLSEKDRKQAVTVLRKHGGEHRYWTLEKGKPWGFHFWLVPVPVLHNRGPLVVPAEAGGTGF